MKNHTLHTRSEKTAGVLVVLMALAALGTACSSPSGPTRSALGLSRSSEGSLTVLRKTTSEAAVERRLAMEDEKVKLEAAFDELKKTAKAERARNEAELRDVEAKLARLEEEARQKELRAKEIADLDRRERELELARIRYDHERELDRIENATARVSTDVAGGEMARRISEFEREIARLRDCLRMWERQAVTVPASAQSGLPKSGSVADVNADFWNEIESRVAEGIRRGFAAELEQQAERSIVRPL